MAHWAFEIAERIIEKNPNKPEYICACGISPSGSVHIGNFRDVATSYFVVKALRAKGKKAKLLFLLAPFLCHAKKPKHAFRNWVVRCLVQ